MGEQETGKKRKKGRRKGVLLPLLLLFFERGREEEAPSPNWGLGGAMPMQKEECPGEKRGKK